MTPFRLEDSEGNGGGAAQLIATQAAHRLRETRRLLTIAESLANLGRWRFDAAEQLFECSPQASAILGLHGNSQLTAAQALARIDPADRFGLLRCLVHAVRSDTEIKCPARLVACRGERKTVLVCAQGDTRPGQPLEVIFGIVRDISDEVAAEAKLIAACDEARAATLAKSEFLATMSHEIRTPMTGVMGMIDLVATAGDEGERAQYLTAMRHSAQMLMSVLDSILDFSKVEAGKIEIQSKRFDLLQLARQTVLLFANAGSAKGIALELDAQPDVSPMVRGDPLRIQQVLSNFISNAVKFTSEGRVVVSLRARPGRTGHQRWRIAVRDTGEGIPRPQLDRLFEPFVQVGPRLAGGTGLGLAISRRLAEAMGGKTSARSKIGHGSTFALEVELPIDGSSKASSPALALAADDPPQRSLNVLIAEDNPINQMLIVAMVRRLGHRATTVDNGRRAADCAFAVPYDCILMDMQMPEMDGVQATRAIRERGGANGLIPIIALTADAAPERRRFYDNIGLTGFITKPIDAEQLRQVLTAVGANTTRAQPRPAPPGQAIDENQIAEIRENLGSEKLRDLLELAQAELAERPLAMRRIAECEEYPELRSEAHNFMGAVASLGLVAVARAAKSVELAAPGTELELALARLDNEAMRARTTLATLLCGVPSDAAAAGCG